MAFESIDKDYYQLEVVNTIVGAYQKNGTVDCGKNERTPVNGYVSEVLVRPDFTNIPDNSTISTVNVLFNSTNANLAPAGSVMGVRLQDKGAWTDTPTTEPLYDTFNDTAWASVIVAEGGTVFPSTPDGSQFIGSTSQMVQMFQDWIDNSVDRNGFLLNYDAETFVYFFTLDSITIDVTFEPPVARSRQFRAGAR